MKVQIFESFRLHRCSLKCYICGMKRTSYTFATWKCWVRNSDSNVWLWWGERCGIFHSIFRLNIVASMAFCWWELLLQIWNNRSEKGANLQSGWIVESRWVLWLRGCRLHISMYSKLWNHLILVLKLDSLFVIRMYSQYFVVLICIHSIICKYKKEWTKPFSK